LALQFPDLDRVKDRPSGGREAAALRAVLDAVRRLGIKLRQANDGAVSFVVCCARGLAVEPGGATDVHEAVRTVSSTWLIIVVGALAAALVGAAAGAQARSAEALAGKTLGPRMDFDLAAHAAPVPAPQRP
jgi:hypothetical protein